MRCSVFWGHCDQADPLRSTIAAMSPDSSIAFFDRQFQRQVKHQDFLLNPFELAALPHLTGRVLDYGCGLGNLAVAAAQRGCTVLALDASPAAISHLKQRAATEALPIEAIEADLRTYEINEDFDCVVSIGLLMFFDRPTALSVLAMLQQRVRPGGIAVVNTLIEGTTWLDLFRADGCCLFGRDEIEDRFASWNIIHAEFSDFDTPDQRVKSFVTIIARKPG